MSSHNPETASIEEVQRLIRRLKRLEDNWPSELMLADLSPQIVDVLLQRIDRQGCAQRMAFTIAATMTLTVLFLHLTVGRPLLRIDMPLIATFLLATGYRPGKENHHAVNALTQTNDLRVLETLILATRYKWGRHPEVIKAINRLLEHVTEADIGLLSDRAQQRLWTIGITWQTLADEYDPQVAIRVLRVLAAIGNHATYARMERFAYRSEHWVGERYAIAAARDLLPVMLARLQRQQVPETLLRAADATAAQPDTLLRAAPATTSEPAMQLLRASTSEHPKTDM